MKKTLLLVIDNLKKGGAEMLLVGILEELSIRFEVILVTLTDECDFNDEQIICSKKYSLDVSDKLSFISGVLKLKKIIKLHKPFLIHSHLIYSTLIARMACPSYIPLLFSIHNELSKNVFNQSKLLTFLEKSTIRKRQTIVAVSDAVLKDYQQIIGQANKTFILKNYISDHFFFPYENTNKSNIPQKIRMVALGNIKASKNYEYLLRSFINLKDIPVSLDIYGNKAHPMLQPLQVLIDEHNISVRFMGPALDIRKTFSNYDLYVMSSTHEGFGIAAVEAMACGLPVLLSDLPVLREVTFNNGLFFDLKDPMALANLIRQIAEGKYNLTELAEKGVQVAKQYTKQKYLEKLYEIYLEVPKQNKSYFSVS